jgi:serine/threonine-protein kinase
VRPGVRALLKGLAISAGLILLALASGYVAMRLTLEPDRVELPSVIGLESAKALERLRERDLRPRIAGEQYADQPKGAIAAQYPAPGARVRRGSDVKLSVSRGPSELKVPSLVGLPLGRARRLLVDEGLQLGDIARVHSDLAARDEVIAQEPASGTEARRGATVHLLVSDGPRGAGAAEPAEGGAGASAGERDRPLSRARLLRPAGSKRS